LQKTAAKRVRRTGEPAAAHPFQKSSVQVPAESADSVLAHLGEALAAVDRTILAGLERHLAGLAAAGADSVVHLTLATGLVLHGSAAVLAALGLILKATAGVELLLTGSPNELFAAFLANQSL